MRKNIFLIIAAFVFLPFFAFGEDLESVCQQIAKPENSCNGLSEINCKVQLEKCAAYYDEQSAEIAKDLTKTTKQKSTLQYKINSLKTKINSLNSQINQGNIMVKDLGFQIKDTQTSIDKTTLSIEESKNQITEILRAVYEEDKKSYLVILLEGSLSDFFSNLSYLESLNEKVSSLLESTSKLNSYLQEQVSKQEDEKSSLQKTIQIQNLQKQENESVKKEQEVYLKITETQYQQQQKEKAEADKNAAAIKARLFEIIGVSKVPTFGEALDIAKYVSNITGVRPALLLAILTQESSLGKNVGQCYVMDFDTGAGTNLQGTAKQRVMNPKSIPSFVELISGLGMETKKTAVSCWIPLYSKGVPYGWGGAMGPAQFIASTWNLYKGKVANITGKTANPWNINDAFLASGLLLKDNGALTNESTAAAKYYCGGNYTRYECKSYANSVLKYASQYEADIKAIGD